MEVIVLYHRSLQSPFDWLELVIEVKWIVMASGWVVIRFTTIYLLLMYERTIYILIKVQQYDSNGTSYTRCDE